MATAPINETNPSFDPSRTGPAPLPDPVRVGVLGLGRIGWLHHAATAAWHGGFRLAAVCDTEAARVEEATVGRDVAGYTSYDAMLADDVVEVVVVASPSMQHGAHTIAAVRAGKHVVCEKPACRDVAAFDRMTAAAEQAGRHLLVHHNQRLYPDCLAVREVLASGRLGSVFRMRRVVTDFRRRDDWQTLKKYHGGVLSNWGTHLVDQLLYLSDSRAAEVFADVSRRISPGDAEDDVRAVIRCENGVLLEIEVSDAVAAPQPAWVVCGDRGSLWIEGGRLHLKVTEGSWADVEVRDTPLAAGRKYGATDPNNQLNWVHETRDAVPLEPIDGFYDCLYQTIRLERAPLISSQSVRRTYETLGQIRAGTGF